MKKGYSVLLGRIIIRPYLLLVSLAMLCSCASGPGVVEAPRWVTAVESVYPRASFVTGRGAGRTREAAAAAAVTDMARVFGVSVSSNVFSRESLHSENGATTGTRELNSETLTRTYIQLFNLRYAEPWWNGQTKQWETVAYINREEAWQIYEPRLKQSLDVFSNLTQAAENEVDATKRYRLLSRAQAVSGETTQMLNYASVLAPEQSGTYQSVRSRIASLPAELARLAGELGIDEARSGNRIETLNYYFSAVTYDPASAEALNRLNEELSDLGVGARIRNEFERQAQWKKDLDDFTRFYMDHPPFALYFTQFGSPPEYNFERQTFDLDFYASLRSTEDLRIMQNVLDSLYSQLEKTGRKAAWGFSGWPGNAPVFNQNSRSSDRRLFKVKAGLFNDRGEILATADFELNAALRVSGEKTIMTDSGQNVRIVFSGVKYDPKTITDNLLVRIIAVNGMDANTAGLEGYMNIIPVSQLSGGKPSVRPGVEQRLFTFGARGGLSLHLYDNAGTIYSGADLSPGLSLDAAIYAAWNFAQSLALQAEVMISADAMAATRTEQVRDSQGTHLYSYNTTYTWSSLPLTVPVLLRWRILNDAFTLSALGGVYVSFPLAAGKSDSFFGTTGDTSLSFPFGAAVGLTAGYRLGPGQICADLRLMADFTKTASPEGDIYRRDSIIFTLGYEY